MNNLPMFCAFVAGYYFIGVFVFGVFDVLVYKEQWFAWFKLFPDPLGQLVFWVVITVWPVAIPLYVACDMYQYWRRK